MNFSVPASGRTYRKKAVIGKMLDLPEGSGKLVLMNFMQSSKFMDHNIGPALSGILTPPNGEPREILLPLHYPNFDMMRQGDIVVSVADQKVKKFSPGNQPDMRWATGLQMTKDPGVWVVYCGFIIM